MSIAINGTTLLTQPSDHHWVQRQSLGDDGNGHPIYPAPREYELDWDIIDVASYAQLQALYNAAGSTGTVVASLPQYAVTSYQNYNYSGCVLQEPFYDKYFEEYYMGVKMLIVSIRA